MLVLYKNSHSARFFLQITFIICLFIFIPSTVFATDEVEIADFEQFSQYELCEDQDCEALRERVQFAVVAVRTAKTMLDFLEKYTPGDKEAIKIARKAYENALANYREALLEWLTCVLTKCLSAIVTRE